MSSKTDFKRVIDLKKKKIDTSDLVLVMRSEKLINVSITHLEKSYFDHKIIKIHI